ncbi:formylmethanofuran dehydrogenase subunit C [Hyphomicrobium sp.]|uniref:formylmethanofuran dehydrogenase subunit C n=1 Tax=Hyphomicrobium sp. TaxID=82 RepID=UPI002E31F1AD|nr:formylmethanofuran dehydrogenase subunit C [Hyphomicrobium sp.]HEX2841140.1 formylmethanofuran dehydrogenase subunit C [Hyphomicrobium sp.]
MSTLSFTLRQAPTQALDLSALIPSRLAGLSTSDIENLTLGDDPHMPRVGDIFAVSGSLTDAVAISGNSSFLDYVGAGLDGGSITVEGRVGNYAGRGIKSGKLTVSGDAGAFLASGAKGGLIHVKGSAGDFLGGARPGDKFGMLGGTVLVDGSVGERAGERMRRGVVVAKGKFGAAAGSRMVGGTLWTEAGFGAHPGPLLRRGTLIGPSVEVLLPTFADCGHIDPVILRILSRYIADTLGPLAPKPLPAQVRKLAGDRATIGKGEILLTA